MFPNYIVIRVYGFEENPSRFPTFLTPHIFSLEVLRQRLHFDELHFESKKQTSTFKVPITVGPFTMRNKATIELIDDMMAYFGFVEDFSCQYDPHHLISKRRKRQKRGDYEHQGTPEMEKIDNMLTLPSDQERKNEFLHLVATPPIPIDAKGNRKIGQDVVMTSTTSSSFKKPKLFKDAFLQVVEYPTPTMESTKGEEVDTK